MRSIFILIFFFFLFNEAQGIRLGNGMVQPVQLLEKAPEKEIIPLVAEGFSKITLYQIQHSNSARNSRKLLIATSPSFPGHHTTMKEEAKKKEKLILKAKDLENNNNNNDVEAELEHFPDLIDIAEMDYSPAKRKTPIHN